MNEGNCLKLSKEAEAHLLPNMRTFIRPLIDRVYGGGAKQTDLKDILALFTNPDLGQARKNLTDLAAQMGMDLTALPAFLEAYGDVYLSLAYYQFNLDAMRPQLAAFVKVMDGLRRQASGPGGSGSYLRACSTVASQLKLAHMQVDRILDVFELRTEAMWENISPEPFNETRELMCSYQNDIGEALCAITVKLKAWSQRFPKETSGHPEDHMNFVVSEMLPAWRRFVRSSQRQPSQKTTARCFLSTRIPRLVLPVKRGARRLGTITDGLDNPAASGFAQ